MEPLFEIIWKIWRKCKFNTLSDSQVVSKHSWVKEVMYERSSIDDNEYSLG